MRCNSKIHVIKDESLGGVEREYIKNYEDIIANLVRRMAHLESELTGAKRDIETWAREVEALKHSEMEPKQITLDVDTFMKIIGGAR